MPSARASNSKTPLSSTALAIHIVDLVAETAIRHHFRNDGRKPIEAVFSFPVPLDAAFVGMRATLAGETLEATIQPKRQASRAYDDAISQGDSAVLLSSTEPGVVCTSLGNLMPGEEGEIELRFVCALNVADRMARFSVPLVHRPRYGTWNLEALEKPDHDFAVEHPMDASIRVEGLLASAPVSCSTHAARFVRQGEALELTIGHAMLDRDLVLTFELAEKLSAVARIIEDGDSSLGMASFVLPVGDKHASREMDLCLVLDGSGSMSGDAIEQSRAAMTSVIDSLGQGDRVQVLRFGSSVVPLLARPLPCTDRVKQSLRSLVSTIDADLGGTEMGSALLQALAQFGRTDSTRSRAVILVTDGAVQPADVAKARSAAIKAGVRIFVVAVGSSAGSEVLGPFAEETGATLERAVPAEPIDAATMRQLRRAREVGPVEIEVRWPGPRVEPLPLRSHYPGDAVKVAALLDASAEGFVSVTAPSLGMALDLPLGPRRHEPSIRALLGQTRYSVAPEKDREAIALHYGLLTRETSAVLVKIRADGEHADGLPQIVQVPQMVPQGMVLMESYSDAAPADMCVSAHAYFAIAVSKSTGTPLAKNKRATVTTDAASPIDASVVLAVFREIYARLVEAAADPSGRFPTAREVIALLESKYQDAAIKLLTVCRIGLDDERQCAQFAIALGSILGNPNMSHEEKTLLATAEMHATRAATLDPGRVDVAVRVIEKAIRKLLPIQPAAAPTSIGATVMTDRTHITVLLDRTGSMQDIRADVVGGFNAFVDTHKAAPGEATLTLVQFDSQNSYELLYAAVPIKDVPVLTLAQYVPRASTPLYDAMGQAIAALDQKLAVTPAGWRPQKIIFVVVTDGQENASVRFRRAQVMGMIDAKKKEGWDFVFLSSDLGALADAEGMGVDAAASLHFGKSAKGSENAWASVAQKSVRRREGAPSVAFDAADRAAQHDAK